MKRRVQQRIKEYRKKRGLTLRNLAEKAGCTQSYISQIEKGLTVPSLSMLGRLSAALDISVIDILSDLSSEDEGNWHLRKANRKTINYPDKRVSSQILASRIASRRMEPLISTIKPGGTSDETEGLSHPRGTEEFVLVLKGEIDFRINEKDIHLSQGDTLDFDGNLPHRWANKGTKAAEVFFIFSPPIW